MEIDYFSPENNVTEPAGFVRRIEAFITTGFAVGVSIVVANWVILSIFPIDVFLQKYGLSRAMSEAMAISIVVFLPLVLFLLDGSSFRATMGMRNRKIRYCSSDGK